MKKQLGRESKLSGTVETKDKEGSDTNGKRTEPGERKKIHFTDSSDEP